MTIDNDEPILFVTPKGIKIWKNKQRKLHRLDGPAVEILDVYKEWRIDGKLHRTDGPAIELANGYKEWWVNGKFHRLDGPAVEFPGVSKSWFINDVELTKEEFNDWVQNNDTEWNNELKTLFKLIYET